MADNKKYYYLKLKDNFFDEDAMIVLESMPDGYLYSNILLKLYLRSVKHEGKLMFNERIPYNPTILAQVTRHSVGVVEKALTLFKDLGLIEMLDNGAIYMSDIQNFIGQSSTEADRKREYRKRIEEEKGQMSGQLEDKSTPEIEIEIEIDKEIELKKEKDIEIYKNVVEYLNGATGKSFKHTTKSTQSKIKARVKEGFTYEDFKRVIDTKVEEWGQDSRMVQYLRPDTLFSPKFESYLNQVKVVSQGVGNDNIKEWMESRGE